LKKKEPATVLPREHGWWNLGWLDGQLFSVRIIAWRVEHTTEPCPEHDDGTVGCDDVIGISPDGFSSMADLWVAFRDPSGRIFSHALHAYASEDELIAELRAGDEMAAHAEKELPN
jgi:hypothetical protein